MKSDEKLDRLLAMSRGVAPDVSRVEAGFETRLMARVRARRAQPMFWGSWSWRLAPVFMAVVVALGALYYAAPQASQDDLHTVIVAEYDNQTAQNFLGGE